MNERGLPVILPLVMDGIGRCDDACPQHDGKRCRLMGCRPETICEPWVERLSARADKLEAALRRVLPVACQSSPFWGEVLDAKTLLDGQGES